MLFEMWTGGSGESLQTMLTLETQYGIPMLGLGGGGGGGRHFSPPKEIERYLKKKKSIK